MAAIANIITAFDNGKISKSTAERYISALLSGKWTLSNIAGEWIPVQYK